MSNRPTKEVPLPSGRKATIQMPGTLEVQTYPTIGKAFESDDEQEATSKRLKFMVGIICRNTVTPKLVETQEEADPDGAVFFWDDWLGFHDFMSLTKEVLEYSGSTKLAEIMDPTSAPTMEPS